MPHRLRAQPRARSKVVKPILLIMTPYYAVRSTCDDFQARLAPLVQRIRKLLADRRIELELTGEAKVFLATRRYDPVFGARPLKRAIQRHLQDPLALKI